MTHKRILEYRGWMSAGVALSYDFDGSFKQSKNESREHEENLVNLRDLLFGAKFNTTMIIDSIKQKSFKVKNCNTFVRSG